MKTFKSSSFAVEFTGTRASAIQSAIEFLSSALRDTSGRWTWRADDDSGFTIVLRSTADHLDFTVTKWNASRHA